VHELIYDTPDEAASPPRPLLPCPSTHQEFNSGGGLAPLIMVQAWSEEIDKLADLAAVLGPDQPVYGIGLPRVDECRQLMTMRGRCRYLAAQLHALPVAPPYHLFGWSFGGVQVLELGRALGSEAGALVMIDTWFMRPSTLHACTARAIRAWYRARRSADPATGALRFFTWFLRIENRHRKEERARRAQMHHDHHEWSRDHGGARSDAYTVEAALRRASSRYRMRTLSRPITYITARDTTSYYGVDHVEPWSAAFAGGYTHVTIDGGHYDLWEKPQLEQLAAALQHACRSATANPTSDREVHLHRRTQPSSHRGVRGAAR
jgi:thioesterase domain-containing protein